MRNKHQQSVRREINEKAARRLNAFILEELGSTVDSFAAAVKIPTPTLRHFLNNASAGSAARRHGRGPYPRTLKPILELKLPDDLRQMLLDVTEFETRVIPGMLRRK
jgi:hypothetical protein